MGRYFYFLILVVGSFVVNISFQNCAQPSENSFLNASQKPSVSGVSDLSSETDNTQNIPRNETDSEDELPELLAPQIVFHLVNQQIVKGDSFSFMVLANFVNDTNEEYQWYLGTSRLDFCDTNICNFDANYTKKLTVGKYKLKVIVKNQSPNSDESTADIEILAPPTVKVPPKLVSKIERINSVNVGDSFVITASASGYPAPSYVWSKGPTVLSRASKLSLSGLKITDSGEYKLKIENEKGFVESKFNIEVFKPCDLPESFKGQKLSVGRQIVMYKTSSVPYRSSCEFEIRTCYDLNKDHIGFLSGSNQYKEKSCVEKCPTGFVRSPELTSNKEKFCVAKYEMSKEGASFVSAAKKQPIVNISHSEAVKACENLGSNFALMSSSHWNALAANIVKNKVNWSKEDISVNNHVNLGNSFNETNKILNSNPFGIAETCGGLVKPVECQNEEKFNSRRYHFLTNGSAIWDLAGNASEWMSDPAISAYVKTNGSVSVSAKTVSGFKFPSYFPVQKLTTKIQALYDCDSCGFGKIEVKTPTKENNAVIRGGDSLARSNAGLFTAVLNVSKNKSDRIGFRCIYKPSN